MRVTILLFFMFAVSNFVDATELQHLTAYISPLPGIIRVNIRYRVRTVEYFKFPNLEGATVWEKLINMGAKRK